MDLAFLGIGATTTPDSLLRPSRNITLNTPSTILRPSLSSSEPHLQYPPDPTSTSSSPASSSSLSASSMSVDASSKSLNASTTKANGEGASNGSAMHLDNEEEEFNALFDCLGGETELRGSFGGMSGVLDQPPGTSILSSIPPLETPPAIPAFLPPLQSSSTITSSHLNIPNRQPPVVDSSLPTDPDPDQLLDMQYPLLPDTLALSELELAKPFGSLSDFQSALGLENEYPSIGDTAGSGFDFDNGDGSGYGYGYGAYRSRSQSPGYMTSDSSIPVVSTNQSRSDHSYHHAESGYALNSSINKTSSSHGDAYLRPNSIEFGNSLPGSISPTSQIEMEMEMMLRGYDNQGRILGDTEEFSFGMDHGLADASASSSTAIWNGMIKATHSARGGSGIGIEPTSVLHSSSRSGTTASGRSNGRVPQGTGRRGPARAAPIDSRSVQGVGGTAMEMGMAFPISLPIPTRSRVMKVRGWQGDDEGGSKEEEVKKAVVVGVERESRKRKRVEEEGEGEEGEDERRMNASLRREMLGLRVIRREGSGSVDEEERERERKRRRVGSLSLPNDKGKGREVNGSDESSESDHEDDEDEDEDDVYCPSHSSSPPRASSSRMTTASASTNTSHRRSGSVQTIRTSTTSLSMSPNYDEDREQTSRRNGGKARGSAALALAKVTMLSGKPATSPWGTYVPFPFEVQDSHDNRQASVPPPPPPLPPQDNGASAIGIRVGRRRRNGHIPLPVPIPHLIKKSRGRKVPYVAGQSASASSGNSSEGKKRGGGGSGDEWKRMFVCEVAGCGKCFVRGEHLKRHVRSIHTHDKPHPCPYEGCDKSFSRRDNLGQHVRIHLPSNS